MSDNRLMSKTSSPVSLRLWRSYTPSKKFDAPMVFAVIYRKKNKLIIDITMKC